MLRKWFILMLLFLLSTGFSSKQRHARGVSEPGSLGGEAIKKDTEGPVIRIDGADGVVVRGSGIRGISIVPDSKGEIIIRGTVEDRRAVKSLTINGQNLRLVGTPLKKKFAVRLKAPEEGIVTALEFLADDRYGNYTTVKYELRGHDAFNPNPSLVLKQDRIPNTRIQSEAPTENMVTTSSDYGRYWALVIGVGEYIHPSIADLQFTVADANDFARVITENYSFEPGRVKLLTNPIRSELIEVLADYAPDGKTPLGDNDNLLIFYAGHGHWDENYREGYWLPSDAEQNNRANWVSNSDVQRAFRGIKARHILLVADACFSGSMFAARSAFTKAIEEAYKLPSRRAITAGVLKEVPDRSVFKEYLVKRLQENTELFLDAGSLYNSIKIPVMNNSPISQRPIYGVIQQTGDEGGEFIFIKRR